MKFNKILSNRPQFLKNNYLLTGVLILIVTLVIGVGYIIGMNSGINSIKEIPVDNPNAVTESSSEPVLPDASASYAEDGFMESSVSFTTVNEPPDAVVLLVNVSSDSATFTITTPAGATSESISLEQFEDSEYLAREFGTYTLTHVGSNETMTIDIRKP